MALQARIASTASIRHVPIELLDRLRSRPELHRYDPLPALETESALASDVLAALRDKQAQRGLLRTAVYCTEQLLTHQVRLLC